MKDPAENATSRPNQRRKNLRIKTLGALWGVFPVFERMNPDLGSFSKIENPSMDFALSSKNPPKSPGVGPNRLLAGLPGPERKQMQKIKKALARKRREIVPRHNGAATSCRRNPPAHRFGCGV